MTRVSSGGKKSGAPAHANRFAFTHNPSSRLTKLILAMPISGVCMTCTEVISWRKKYRKYKPLTVPKKCVRCQEKSIKEAYHVVCNACARNSKICCKCLQPFTAANMEKDLHVSVVEGNLNKQKDNIEESEDISEGEGEGEEENIIDEEGEDGLTLEEEEDNLEEEESE